MKRLLPILLLSLVACERSHNINGAQFSGLGRLATGGDAHSKGRSINVLIAGQSNADFMYSHEGMTAFTSDLAKAGYSVHYIDCAVPATSISEWQISNALYQNCVRQVGLSRVSMVLWWQGEAEASSNLCSIWAQSFTTIARQMQTDFKAPILYARLGDTNNLNLPDWEAVREQQESVSIPHTKMVSLDGIAPAPGDLHYLAEGYRACQDRFAEAFLVGV